MVANVFPSPLFNKLSATTSNYLTNTNIKLQVN